MYFGAVPVVLKGSWPFEDESLPVLAVETWEAALDFIGDSPLELWQELVSGTSAAMWMPHYLEKILGP